MTVIQSIYQLDLRLLLWSQKFQQFSAIIRVISRTGDGYMQVLFPCLYWLSYPIEGNAFLMLTLSAFAIERPLYFSLKNLLKRRRPPEIVPYFTSVIRASDQFSFPSGHTMAAFLLAGLATSEMGFNALPLYFWAGAVAISRVVLGVHFPSDILAGATLGTLIAYITAIVTL